MAKIKKGIAVLAIAQIKKGGAFFALKVNGFMVKLKCKLINTIPAIHWTALGISGSLMGLMASQKTNFGTKYLGGVKGDGEVLLVLGILVPIAVFLILIYAAKDMRRWRVFARVFWWVDAMFSTATMAITFLVNKNLIKNWEERTVEGLKAELWYLIAVFALLQLIRPSTDFGLFSYFSGLPSITALTIYGWNDWKTISVIVAVVSLIWTHNWLAPREEYGSSRRNWMEPREEYRRSRRARTGSRFREE